jgi:hypothetical protein
MDHYLKEVKKAEKNGSLELLRERFDYLRSYGSQNKDFDFRITLCYETQGFGVSWETKKKHETDDCFKPWMYGGLIYFESDNTWSIHT